jgi:hypothetical protein
MMPRAYGVVGVASAAVLATLVAASLPRGPILGIQRVGHADESPPPPVKHPRAAHGLDGSGIPTWLTVSMTVLLALYAIGLVVLVAIRRLGREEEEEPDDSVGDGEDEVSSAWETVLAVDLSDAANEQLALLHRGTPRNAIVACWLALQAATVSAGLPEDPAETAQEYLVRAVRSLGLDPPAITVLGALYREARFSEHVMVESQRDLAEESLRVLVQQLASRPSAEPDLLLEGSPR